MKTLRHVGIVVTNLNRSLHFYKDLLGLRITKELNESGDFIDKILGMRGTHVRTVKLKSDEGKSLVELLHFKTYPRGKRKISANSIGYTHVSFSVRDIRRQYRKLIKSGVEFNSPPQDSPDGYAKVAFCKDPDGNLIELVQELKK